MGVGVCAHAASRLSPAQAWWEVCSTRGLTGAGDKALRPFRDWGLGQPQTPEREQWRMCTGGGGDKFQPRLEVGLQVAAHPANLHLASFPSEKEAQHNPG